MAGFFKSASTLYLAQLPLILIPLIITPLYARFLSKSDFAILMLSQAVTLFVSVFSEYNFTLFASRLVVVHHSDKNMLSEIVSSVTSAKILISAIIVLSSLPVCHYIFKDFGIVASTLSILSGILIGFSPFWFFQGTGRITKIVSIDVTLRTFGSAGGLIASYFYRNPLAPILVMFIFYFISFIVSHFIMLSGLKARFSFKMGLTYIRDGFSLFLTKAISSAYLQATPILLAGFLPAHNIAGFIVAERFMRFITTSIAPVNNILYPRIVKLSNDNFSRAHKTTIYLCAAFFAAGVVLTGVLLLFSKQIIGYLTSNKYSLDDIKVFSLLSLFLPLALVNSYLGSRWLVSLKKEGELNKILSIAAVIHILVVIASPTRYKIIISSASIISTEVVILILTAFVSAGIARKKNRSAVYEKAVV